MTSTLTASDDIERLIEIMAALRHPATGCPWDVEQTFETIAPFTIEEAYEVGDAIARGDRADLKDELGDLLLQIVFHARMAEEENSFVFGDVVRAITTKMIRRHPHVFGDARTRSLGAANGFWDAIKAQEKAERATERALLAQSVSGAARGADTNSVLDDVPAALPALIRATKLQEKAARVGFDWPSLAPVFDKMREELAELEAVARPPVPEMAPAPIDRGKIEEEFGDLLFVMANVARHLKLDPEAALRGANRKFTRRFGHIEARLAGMGRSPADSTLAEMDALWDEAKAVES